MGENLLCLRVSTSRYPTAASSHRTPILRCTVKVSSTHIDGFYTLGCLAFEVLQRDHTIMLFLQEDSVVPVDNSGFKQYDSEYAKISNQSVTRMYLRGQTETLWLFFVCLVFFSFYFEVLDALHMDTMMSHVDSWRSNPDSFLRERGLNTEPAAEPDSEEVFVLIVEGFLIFNHRYKWETSDTCTGRSIFIV